MALRDVAVYGCHYYSRATIFCPMSYVYIMLLDSFLKSSVYSDKPCGTKDFLLVNSNSFLLSLNHHEIQSLKVVIVEFWSHNVCISFEMSAHFLSLFLVQLFIPSEYFLSFSVEQFLISDQVPILQGFPYCIASLYVFVI